MQEKGRSIITRSDQLRPKDLSHALRSPSFKTALLKFLIEEWKYDKYAAVIKTKRVVAAHKDRCLQYKVDSAGGKVEHNVVPKFVCSHVMADTRLAFHLSELSKAVPGKNIVIRATDTDVMIILLLSCQSAKCKCMDGRWTSQ